MIVNPRSGGGGVDLSEALSVLAANHWHVDIRQKLHEGYAVKLAREVAGEGFDVVVACGGDGTVSEVIDGLTGTDIAVGTLPAGTEDVWSREIGVSTRLRVAATQLVGAERLKVDVTRQAVSLLVRQRPSALSAETYRAKELRVFAPSVVPLQLDGGAITQDEIDVKREGVVYEFSVLPRAVTVLVPKTYDGELLESGSLRASEHALNGKAGKGKRRKHKKG